MALGNTEARSVSTQNAQAYTATLISLLEIHKQPGIFVSMKLKLNEKEDLAS